MAMEEAMSAWFDTHRHLYPDDWNDIARRVKEAAGWKCEACGNPHGPSPYVLTVDHVVDHDPSNVSPENLAAYCQRCHLRRQGMRPKPATKEEATRRLRERYEAEQSQLRIAFDETGYDPTAHYMASMAEAAGVEY
jgi:5-methylcytosine-specific restriction endonuclease McrA